MAKSLNYVAIPFLIFVFVSVTDAASSHKSDRREAHTSTTSSTAPTSPLSFLTDQPFNDFDWALTKILDREVKDNFVVSPISVKLAIGMLYIGVDGPASKEIEKALRINSTLKSGVVKKLSEVALSLERSKNNEHDLNVGTKLFVDSSTKVNEDYRRRLLRWFNATVDLVDFKAPADAIVRINKWCEEITQGKIKELISPGEPLTDTAMMLVNAIYFRGEWEKQFPLEGTKMETFWAYGEDNISVPTMHVKSEYMYYNSTDLRFHLLRMPYMGKKFAMYLIVPHDIDGLPALAMKITPEGLAKSLKLMKKYNINLTLPKFQFESTSVLVPILEELQIKELFNPKTNLEKIGSSPNGPLSISKILQKSGIEVNERGSVAYAPTEVHIVSRFGEAIFNLDVNRPFLFLIADEEKDAIIFTGKVLNPDVLTLDQMSTYTETSCILPLKSYYQTFTVHCPNTANCPHEAGEKVPTFTHIRVNCTAGYRFSEGNTSAFSCFQGKWSPPISNCYRTCAPIKNPDLELNCLQKIRGIAIPCDEDMPVGAIVYPRCKDFYHQNREVDYTFIRCQSNGQWDQQLFKCTADCGIAQGNTKVLIAGGKPERQGDSPWHVAIYDVSDPKEPTLICGGTIITQQIIVSAAHCFYDDAHQTLYNSSSYEVAVAKYTLDYKTNDYRETKKYKIAKISTPDVITFTGQSTFYVGDIALLRTSERITFSGLVLPACVDWTNTNRFIVPDGTVGKLVGWGTTEKGEQSSVLLATLLPYINYRNCRTMVSADFNIGADKFCAGTKSGAGARPGDSGGGLLFRRASTHGNLYYIRGVVSNKDATAGENHTSIAAFTDVAQFVTWMYEKRIEIENEEILAETTVGLKT